MAADFENSHEANKGIDNMSNGRSANFILAVLTILTTIALAAIPWAYSVHGRLTEIETLLKGFQSLSPRLTIIERETIEMRFRVVSLERKSDRLHPE